jgi:hypothetical protein
VPVTAVAATLFDVAATLTAAYLARACHEAAVLHGTTPADVEAALDRRPNATGSAKLRYTYGDVFDEPSLMLAELTRLLRGSRPA